MNRYSQFLLLSFITSLAAFTSTAQASGLQLESSVVVVDTQKGEGVITLKNTDSAPILLYSSVENTAQDKEDLLVVTPPVARVDPGETQMVRFMLKNKKNITAERLKRAIFEGIPAARKGQGKLQITLRQNVPLIIHPTELGANSKPWEGLNWQVSGSELKVTNSSKYVVRMSPDVQLLPQKSKTMLPRTYILPGESIVTNVKNTVCSTSNEVEFQPANLYGYLTAPYKAKINSCR